MMRPSQSLALLSLVVLLSACARVPYGDQLPVTPDIPRDTTNEQPSDVSESTDCPPLNTDPATTTVAYANDDMGIRFTIPYNDQWGPAGHPLPAYSEHSADDNDPLGFVLFGPPTSGALEGLGGGCDPIQSYDLTFLPHRTQQAAVHAIEGRGTEIVPNTTVRTINTLTVVEYTDAGLCSYPTIEVIGKKYNYSFTTSCGGDEAEEQTYLENIVKTVELTK